MTLRNVHRRLQPGWKILAVCAFALWVAVLLVAGRIPPVFAQGDDAAWSEPLNLSRSGGADSPQIFFDSQNRGHAVWQDEFEGVMVAQQNEDGAWSEPLPVSFEFSRAVSSVRFIPDGTGSIHVFWQDPGPAEKLQYSLVVEDQFSDPAAWSPPLSLGEGIAAFDVGLDGTGRLHLLYQQSSGDTEDAAGVYYLSSTAPGGAWDDPVLLFASRYFRGMTTLDSNLSLSVGEDGRVHAAWDLPALEQVFYTRSDIAGSNWQAGEVFDSRSQQDSFDATGPGMVQLAASGPFVFRFWMAGHDGATCSQYVQVSPDGGATWSERSSFSQEIPGCPADSRALVSSSGDLVWMTVRQVGVFFRAWEGGRWSAPQLQTPLSAFTDPETFRQVDLACRQPVFDRNDRLFIAGCDAGEGEDIWLLSRPLGTLQDWFPTPTPTVPWSSPNPVVNGGEGIRSVALAADGSGRLHAFWNQDTGDAVRYARWSGGGQGAGLDWSPPVDAVQIPGGKAQDPAAVISPSGMLYLVWSGGSGGGIGFSSVRPDLAVFPGEWRAPQQLPVPRSATSSPVIALDAYDAIYVAYAVPVNEHRGVYLVRSQDGGETWSDPLPVLDAEASGWDMVAQPAMAITGDGRIHMLATRYAIDADNGISPQALLYRVSADGGQTWEDEQIVSTRPVYASAVLGIGGNSLQRIWSDLSGERLSLWYQLSHDSGASWSEARRVSEYGIETPQFSLTLDQAGAAHIVQVRSAVISDTGVSSVVLQHNAWDGYNWQLVENVDLGAVEITGLASAVTARGALGTLYVQEEVSGQSGSGSLLFTDRPLSLAISIPTPPPTGTPAPGEALQLTPALEPSPTPTIAFSRQTRDPGLLGSLGTVGGVIAGAVPVLLIVLVVVVIGRRRQMDR